MFEAGAARERLARILGAAFADGLLSEQTLTHRLGLVFGQRLVDPSGVVGDLSLPDARRRWRWPPFVAAGLAACRRTVARPDRVAPAPLVLALDWAGDGGDLVIGRGFGSDVALLDGGVSRRHALLVCRGSAWVIEDLGSLNGTFVNGVSVGRCRLEPGDRIAVGEVLLEVD
jgi:FHA domain